MNNWYVVTGAPASGKTTVLEALEKKGNKVIYEAARILIDQELAKGRTLKEIRADEPAFQRQVLEMKIKIENELPKDQMVFLDRAIPDTVAYDRWCKAAPNPLLNEAMKKVSYKKIFLLEQLPFTVDYARTENADDQHLLQQYLLEAYQSLNSPIIKVPVLPVDERVKFILNNIEQS